MRVLCLVAVIIALVGCGAKKEVGGKPIGEPPGYRFVKESDPVGTVIYERGVQWIGSDHEPTIYGILKEKKHLAASGVWKGQEVVTVESNSTKRLDDEPASMFYEMGVKFVKE